MDAQIRNFERVKQATMTDAFLVNGIINRDEEYFKILVERFQELVFRTSFAFVKNQDDANDIAQDVFILVFKNIHKFRGDSSLSTWLYRIAVNQSINFLRQNKWRNLVSRVEDFFGNSSNHISKLIPGGTNPSEMIENKEMDEIVNQAISCLPENQRTAFILHKYDDLPQQQIAEIMNISVSAVESLVFRAKMSLQKKLIHFYEEYYQ
jgi:RNA polymerase sigma-70 factor, ECF subfamily